MSGQTIDLESTSWCWSHLGTEGEGVLSYESPRGRRSLAVPYTVIGRQITIPLAAFNETGWRAEGTNSRLEVSGRTSEDLRWVVRATGKAERDRPAKPTGLEYSRYVHPANHRDLDSADPSERLHLQTPRMRGFCATPLPA